MDRRRARDGAGRSLLTGCFLRAELYHAGAAFGSGAEYGVDFAVGVGASGGGHSGTTRKPAGSERDTTQ